METSATPPTTAVAPRTNASVQAAVGEVTGEMGGIKLLYLKPTYGVGGQHDAGFDEGTLVIDGKFSVSTKKDPVPVIIIGATQFWKDWLGQAEFAAGIKSQRYPDEASAIAAGKRTQWIDDPAGGTNPVTGRPARLGPQAAAAFDLKVLVRKPASTKDAKGDEVNVDTEFFLRIGEYFYCPSLITFEKMAYAPFSQVLLQSRVMAAQEQKVSVQHAKLHRWLYQLGTEILPAKTGRKSALIPKLSRMLDPQTKRGAVLAEADVAELEGLMAALSNASAAAGEASSEPMP